MLRYARGPTPPASVRARDRTPCRCLCRINFKNFALCVDSAPQDGYNGFVDSVSAFAPAPIHRSDTASRPPSFRLARLPARGGRTQRMTQMCAARCRTKRRFICQKDRKNSRMREKMRAALCRTPFQGHNAGRDRCKDVLHAHVHIQLFPHQGGDLPRAAATGIRRLV